MTPQKKRLDRFYRTKHLMYLVKMPICCISLPKYRRNCFFVHEAYLHKTLLHIQVLVIVVKVVPRFQWYCTKSSVTGLGTGIYIAIGPSLNPTFKVGASNPNCTINSQIPLVKVWTVKNHVMILLPKFHEHNNIIWLDI